MPLYFHILTEVRVVSTVQYVHYCTWSEVHACLFGRALLRFTVNAVEGGTVICDTSHDTFASCILLVGCVVFEILADDGDRSLKVCR